MYNRIKMKTTSKSAATKSKERINILMHYFEKACFALILGSTIAVIISVYFDQMWGAGWSFLQQKLSTVLAEC